MNATWNAVGQAPERVAVAGAAALAVAVGVMVAAGQEMLTVAALGSALFVLLFVWNPVVALLAYVVARPAVDARVQLPVGPLTLGQLWGAGFLLILVACLVGARHRSGPEKGIALPVLMLIVLYGAFAVRGQVDIAYQSGLKLTGWALLLLVVEQIARTRSGQLACFRAGYALAVTSAIVIGLLAATGEYGASFYDAVMETGGAGPRVVQDPQPLAFLALFSIAFPLIALLMRWWTFPSLVLVGALAAEIVLSYVRTALVALVILVFVYVFVSARRRRLTSFGLVGALAVTAYLAQGRLATRFADVHLLWSGQASNAGSNRGLIWLEVWDTTTSSLGRALFGAGAGASNALSEVAIGRYVDSHNDYLEYFATGGLLLACAYVVFVVWAWRSVWRVHRSHEQSSTARAVAAIGFGSLGAFFVVSLLASISFYIAPVGFAILLGLIRGMDRTPTQTCFDPVIEPGEGAATRLATVGARPRPRDPGLFAPG